MRTAHLERMEKLGPAVPRYTHAAVVTITGITGFDVQNWVNRGLFTPAIASPGKAGRRLYSFLDVAILWMASRLIELGLPSGTAFKAAPVVTDALLSTMDAHSAAGATDTAVDKYCTLIRREASEGPSSYRITTFRNDSIPVDDILADPAIIMNTGQQLEEISKRVLEFSALEAVG